MSNASPLEYVDVVITRDIEVVSRVGFGSLLFLGTTEDKQTPKIAQYANFDAVAAVFADGDPEYEAALAYFGQTEKPTRIYIGTKDSYDATFTEALQEIQAINSDWYAVAIASREAADILEVSAYIQTQDKLFLACTADVDVKDPDDDTDIASVILDLTRDRTAIFYHSEADLELFPEVALSGRVLPLDPGSATWAWKTISGVPSDSLDATDRVALEEKRVTYYQTVAGTNVTFEGQVSAPGVFIDLIRGKDWLRFRLAEDLVATLANANKIPYIGGDVIIEAKIRGRLAIAVANGVIADDFQVTVPPASEQESENRIARIYAGITFSGTYTGAVHKVTMRGSFSV